MSNKETDHTREIELDQTRHLRFTSSQMYKLTSMNRKKDGPGATFKTAVDETYYGHLSDRRLEVHAYSRAMAWGEFAERFAFDQLGLEWRLESQVQYTHEQWPEWWSGRPDIVKDQNGARAVGDIKCPEPKAFCEMADLFLNSWDEHTKIEYMKGDSTLKKYYWQLVSNAILTGADICQLIIFLPTRLQLQEIQDAAQDIDEETLWPGRTLWDYKYIADSPPEKLPYLPGSSRLKPMHSFIFTPPPEDIDLLSDRVALAISEVQMRLKTFDENLKNQER